MSNTNARKLIVGFMVLGMLSACSKGMNAGGGSSSSSGNSGQSTPGGGTGGSNPSTPIQNVDMKGFVDGGTYDRTQTFDFNTTTGMMSITVPLGFDSSILIGNASISQLPGVTFSTKLASDGTTQLVVSIPASYFLRGVNTLPAGALPDGSPLPAMPSATLPMVAFSLNPNSSNKAYLYVGVNAVGIYVQSNLLSCGSSPVCGNITVPVKNQTKTKILGFLTLVMGKGSSPGGFFVSMILPSDIAAILDDYFSIHP